MRCVYSLSCWAVRTCTFVCWGCSWPGRRLSSGKKYCMESPRCNPWRRQDGSSPPTFLSSLLHAVFVFSVGNTSLVLQSRPCSELNSLTPPPHPPSLPSLIFSHWVYFQTLGALCFLFKIGIPAIGDCGWWGAVMWDFRGGLLVCLRSHSKLQLWWWHLTLASFPTTLPPSVFLSLLVFLSFLSFKNDLLSSTAMLEGA